jgi:hypothetical protein
MQCSGRDNCFCRSRTWRRCLRWPSLVTPRPSSSRTLPTRTSCGPSCSSWRQVSGGLACCFGQCSTSEYISVIVLLLQGVVCWIFVGRESLASFYSGRHVMYGIQACGSKHAGSGIKHVEMKHVESRFKPSPADPGCRAEKRAPVKSFDS